MSDQALLNLSNRMKNEVYLGFIGSSRSGKSTLINSFIKLLILPNINDEFIKHKKNYYYGRYGHSGFSNNENPDDYYFIYSDSIIDELTGEIDCYIIHFDYVEISNIHVNKKNYRYNVEMTIYKENSLEGYRYKI